MDYSSLKTEVEQKTAQTLEVLQNEFAGLRTGRASVHLLDGVRVPVYGSDMPLNQLATVSTPDNQTLNVTVWDMNNVGPVEKAIRDSGLGLNPMSAGAVIRLNMPPLTEERRREIVKTTSAKVENAKIAIRKIRDDARKEIKNLELPQDEQRKAEAKVDDMTKEYNTQIEDLFKQFGF